MNRNSIAGRAAKRIEQFFANHPNPPISYIYVREKFALSPRNGVFKIEIYDEGDVGTLSTPTWHDHFKSEVDLASVAIWLLTPFYRIVTERKGNEPSVTWAERYNGENWEQFGITFLINPTVLSEWQLLPGEQFIQEYYVQNVIDMRERFARLVQAPLLDEDGLPPGTVIGISETISERSLQFALVKRAAKYGELHPEETTR